MSWFKLAFQVMFGMRLKNGQKFPICLPFVALLQISGLKGTIVFIGSNNLTFALHIRFALLFNRLSHKGAKRNIQYVGRQYAVRVSTYQQGNQSMVP